MSTEIRTRVLAVAVAMACWLLLPVEATSVYPLELTNIRSGIDANNRVSRAYPGLEYNIRAAVIGGAYPYTFSLENAAPGMTINASTGELVWPDPKADATPTIVVVDSAASRASATWTITVSKRGFKFIDGVAGKSAQGNSCSADCGQGTAEQPWKTLLDAYTKGAPGDVLYFRNGTYVVPDDIPRQKAGETWDRVEFNERSRPVIWLAQPGAKPVIDFGYRPGGDPGRLVRFYGNNIYVDGLEAINARIIGFQIAGDARYGPTLRRLKMRKLGPGIDGTNAAFIMTMVGQPANYMVVQDCEFSEVTGQAVTIKIYSQQKLLIENTVHHHTAVAIELKHAIPQFTVRANRFYDVEDVAIGGNMAQTVTHGEVLFNNVRAGVALDLNQNGMAQRIDVYRNTFVGRVRVRNTDSADGPFVLKNNIILSDDGGRSRITLYEVTDASRIQPSDNLVGDARDRIVDAEGNLVGGHVKSIGKFGHQIPRSQP